MTEKKKICWSPAPKESYSVFYAGQMMGPGLDPVMAAVPGAWNILWLTVAPELDRLLNYEGDPGQFPTAFTALPASVGTALQMLPGGVTLGDLAETMPPSEWLQAVRLYPGLMLEKLYPGWLQIAEANLARYRPSMEGVIQVDFKGKRRLQ
jgi:hypothetical protein